MVFERFRLLRMLPVIVPLLFANLLIAQSQGQRPLTVSVAPSSIGPGDVVRIDVIGTAEKPVTGTMFGKDLTFWFDARATTPTWSTLAGVDLETKPGKYRLRIDHGGTPVSTRLIQVQPRQFRVRRLRVPDTFVNPPPDALAQIISDNKALAAAYAQNTPRRWNGAFVLPVDGTPTSNFGTRSYYNGLPRSPHAGVDFMSGPGTPIRASNHGSIALAAALYFTGNTVIVDHGARLFSVFAHLVGGPREGR